MAADSAGNDITQVAIPVTGSLAFATSGTAVPAAEDGGDPEDAAPVAFKKAGLVKQDGGPQVAWGATGDALEMWQAGYSIKTGDADVTVTVTLAQHDAIVREIVFGKVPDVNGMIIVDGGGHDIIKTLL